MSLAVSDLRNPPSPPCGNSPASQLASIRARLKEWEKAFATSHDGQKPSREDIKNDDSGIGNVYKEYNRVRELAEGKPEKGQKKVESHSRKPSLKRQRDKLHDNDAAGQLTPRKQKATTSTPRKAHAEPETYDRPSSSSTTPRPFLKSFIGPTPQRDGKVLGLFDLLPPSGDSSKATPSTRKRKADALNEANTNIVQTPSRKKSGDILDHLDDDDGVANTGRRQRFERTPTSEGKKFLLSQFFATPNTARFMPEVGEEGEEHRTRTPLRAKLLAGREELKMDAQPSEPAPDATPTFLRRSSSLNQKFIGQVGGELSFASPEKIRTGPQRLSLFRKGRSLSEIVKNLRKVQDEEHDDDMEALNEMEAGSEPEPETDVQIGDSQVIGSEGREQEPRIWKKKGQKRTTRRTNMKPPTVKKSKELRQEERPAEEESEDEATVADTQGTSPGQYGDDSDFDLDLEPIVEEGEGEGKDSAKPVKKAISEPAKKAATSAEPKGRRTVKANSVAQMNFRSLKIKNKNSKAKGRGFGRFGGRGRR